MASAQYQVLDEEKCQVRNFGTSGTSNRNSDPSKQTTELKNLNPQTSSLKIPLTHHVGLWSFRTVSGGVICQTALDELNARTKSAWGRARYCPTPDQRTLPLFLIMREALPARHVRLDVSDQSPLPPGKTKLLHCSQARTKLVAGLRPIQYARACVTLGRDESWRAKTFNVGDS